MKMAKGGYGYILAGVCEACQTGNNKICKSLKQLNLALILKNTQSISSDVIKKALKNFH
jgi:hypothetical protein